MWGVEMGQRSLDGVTCEDCPPHSDPTQPTSYCSVYSFFKFLKKTTVLAMYKLYSSRCDWYYALLNYWNNIQNVVTIRDWNKTLMNQWNRILNKLCSQYKTVCTFVGCIAGYQPPPAHSGPLLPAPLVHTRKTGVHTSALTVQKEHPQEVQVGHLLMTVVS